MAHELNTMMEEFSRLATNYCDNAKKFMPTGDHVRLVEVYQTGLTALLDGTWRRFREMYAATSDTHRQEIDSFIELSGMIPMLRAANGFIGPGTANADALYEAGSIFEKPKSAIREIPGWIPIVGWAGGALRLIDEVIDNIRKLIPTSDKAPKTLSPASGVFDPNVRPSGLVSCDASTFPIPGAPRDVEIDYTEATEAGKTAPLDPSHMPEIEVEADGHPHANLTGANRKITLKNCSTVKLHLKGDPGQYYGKLMFRYQPKK